MSDFGGFGVCHLDLSGTVQHFRQFVNGPQQIFNIAWIHRLDFVDKMILKRLWRMLDESLPFRSDFNMNPPPISTFPNPPDHSALFKPIYNAGYR